MEDLLLEPQQAMFFRIKLGQAARRGCSPECAVEIISPSVKRADDSRLARSPLIGHDPGAAMPADIVETSYLSVFAAHGNGTFSSNIERHMVANLRNIADMAE